MKLVKATVGCELSCGYPNMKELAGALEKEKFTILHVGKFGISVEVAEDVFERIGKQKLFSEGPEIGPDGRYTIISRAMWVEIAPEPIYFGNNDKNN